MMVELPFTEVKFMIQGLQQTKEMAQHRDGWIIEMRVSIMASFVLWLLLAHQTPSAFAYPLDGYETTGIGRLEAARRIQTGQMRGRKQPPGALLPTKEVDLRLADQPNLTLPRTDPAFSAQIVELLGTRADRYGISVLDLSDPHHPRYAEHRGDVSQNPGSVGKIIVALAMFQALADLYPDDLEKRKKILRGTVIIADVFHKYDHHTVRLWNPETGKLTRRPLRDGDRGTMWEYLDWMMSPSSNAAAGMLMKHLMLLTHFGKRYPVSESEATAFFQETPKKRLGEILARSIQEPVTRNGLDLKQLRQGSFLTREGKKRVPGTSSYATSRELVRFALLMEQGKLVDPFSSREIKRLLYVTERRIRYASAPALRSSAVYFKSGSLYQCAPEPGFKCKKYHGNVKNYMNSLALVEHPPGRPRLYYFVSVLSNVLKKNSAVDHQTLAARIHRLIEKAHAGSP